MDERCSSPSEQSPERGDDSPEPRAWEISEKCASEKTNSDYVCKLCNKSFAREQYLTNHIKVHAPKKIIICEICCKTFTRRGTLKDHLMTHTGEKPHECNVCGKTFNKKGHMKKHLLTHTGVKSHTCNICDKSFTERGHLKRHLLTHSGEKPHVCDICSKSFAQKGHLRVHVLSHSGEKPHVCNTCGMSFRRKYFLNKHSLVHSGEGDANDSPFDREDDFSSTSEKSENVNTDSRSGEKGENSRLEDHTETLQQTEEIYFPVKEEPVSDDDHDEVENVMVECDVDFD